MRSYSLFSAVLIAALAGSTSASLQRRQKPTNIVDIKSATDHCIIAPRYQHVNINDSKYTDGTNTYCTQPAQPHGGQGLLPDDFWSNVELKNDVGIHGEAYIQLTGCIRPSGFESLNPDDAGGLYSSDSGQGGVGMPPGSVCLGWNSYVEIIEPSANRACVRCCEDPADCPFNKDVHCPVVVPGNYFDCA